MRGFGYWGGIDESNIREMLNRVFRVSPFAEELCSDAMRREISERVITRDERVNRGLRRGTHWHPLPVPLQCAESWFSEDAYGPH